MTLKGLIQGAAKLLTPTQGLLVLTLELPNARDRAILAEEVGDGGGGGDGGGWSGGSSGGGGWRWKLEGSGR